MMLSKSKHIAWICGAAAIAVTIIFYLSTFANIFTVPMRWLSFMFLILAEAIGTVKVFTVKRTILGVSNIVTSIVHVVAVLMVSIVFVNFFPLLIKRYIALNVLALCILLAADVMIFFFASHVAAQNSKLNESRSAMGCCVEKAASLCMEYSDTEHKKALEEVVELLKYSDSSCLSQDEMAIMDKLDEVQRLLKSQDNDLIEKIIEIKNVIKLRSIKVASVKRGNY